MPSMVLSRSTHPLRAGLRSIHPCRSRNLRTQTRDNSHQHGDREVPFYPPGAGVANPREVDIYVFGDVPQRVLTLGMCSLCST